jgi:hypothetical protein
VSVTLADLKIRVSRVLNDPDQKTFTSALVEELITAGLIEIGRIAPERFVEDIDFVAGQQAYPVRSVAFDAVAVDEIEVVRVEVWDFNTSPYTFRAVVPPASTEFTSSDSGWSFWGGYLYLPVRTMKAVSGLEDTYTLRVWGYSPYVLPDEDADVIGISKELEQAVIDFTRFEAINMLLASRDLFTQWQTRSGNTDISPAGLMNQWNVAEAQWRRKSRAIQRLRTAV